MTPIILRAWLNIPEIVEFIFTKLYGFLRQLYWSHLTLKMSMIGLALLS